jgi:hypothetical protein
LSRGESAVELIEILKLMKRGRRPNGMWHFELSLPCEQMAPLVRAIMRVEAELLLDDARRVGTDDEERRTPEQRRADALVALTLRVADALKLHDA